MTHPPAERIAADGDASPTYMATVFECQVCGSETWTAEAYAICLRRLLESRARPVSPAASGLTVAETDPRDPRDREGDRDRRALLVSSSPRRRWRCPWCSDQGPDRRPEARSRNMREDRLRFVADKRAAYAEFVAACTDLADSSTATAGTPSGVGRSTPGLTSPMSRSMSTTTRSTPTKALAWRPTAR